MKTTNKPFTCIASSHSGLATPTDRAMWEAIRKTPNLIGIAEKINEPGITDEEVRALKSQLPIWTPRCAKFKNNHRAEADAEVLTYILVFDIDEKGRTEYIMVKTNPYLYPCYGPFEIVLIEESIRHGTHVAVKLPAGMTPEEAQREFSRMIGLKVDPVVKSVAGCIYQVPESFTRYVSDELFKDPPQPSLSREGGEPGTTNNSTSEKTFEKEENSTPDS